MSWWWFSSRLRRPIVFKTIHRVWMMGAVTIVTASLFIPRMFTVRGDGHEYLAALHFINGDALSIAVPFHRLIAAPLFLATSFVIGKLLGDISLGLVVLNILGYFVMLSGMYYLTKVITRSEMVALIATFLVMTNQVILNFGLGFMADSWGPAWYLWGSYWAINYFYQPAQKKYFWLAISSAIIGFFFREYGVLGLLTLGMVILLRVRPLSLMVKQGLIAVGAFLPLPLIFYYWFYQHFGVTYLDWFNRNVSIYGSQVSGAAQYGPVLIIKILGWIFLAGWPLVIWGLWQLRTTGREMLRALVCLVPSSLFFLLWPSQNERVAFILVPLLAIISAIGLQRISKPIIITAILAGYIIVNFYTDQLKLLINI